MSFWSKHGLSKGVYFGQAVDWIHEKFLWSYELCKFRFIMFWIMFPAFINESWLSSFWTFFRFWARQRRSRGPAFQCPRSWRTTISPSTLPSHLSNEPRVSTRTGSISSRSFCSTKPGRGSLPRTQWGTSTSTRLDPASTIFWTVRYYKFGF